MNLIKIGRSADPERRVYELQLLSPVPLEIIGVLDGDAAFERELHSKFHGLHSHGEWFHATTEMKEFARIETMVCIWKKLSGDAQEKVRLFVDSKGPGYVISREELCIAERLVS